VRLLGAGAVNKNDPNDARSVAVAALRSPARREVPPDDHAAVLKVWAKRHRDLGRARTQVACRLHAVLCDLIAGGVSKRISAAQAGQLLEGISPAGAVDAARYEPAAEFRADLRRIDAQMREAKKKLTVAVRASGTTLTSLFGVGPIVAATVIGEARDVARFADRDHFDACNGTAPIEVSSGQRKIYRLSRRGNRRLNHAIHMAAVTRSATAIATDGPTTSASWPRAKHPKRHSGLSSGESVTRCSPSSKRTPAGPWRARAEEPGRATGERLCRPRGRLTRPGTGSSAKPLPRTRYLPTHPTAGQGATRNSAEPLDAKRLRYARLVGRSFRQQALRRWNVLPYRLTLPLNVVLYYHYIERVDRDRVPP